MPRPERRSLWSLSAARGARPGRFIADGGARLHLAGLAGVGSPINQPRLAGRSALISSDRQAPAVRAMLGLDGLARRIVLCPPDLDPAHLPHIIAEAEVDAIVTDGTGPASHEQGPLPRIATDDLPPASECRWDTEWLLLTSGTTGRPKLVVHSLSSLAGPLEDSPNLADTSIWSTFYDARRYGGVTILFRALLGGVSMVLSQRDEPLPTFLERAQREGVTHISGTPSHWRRALMCPAVTSFTPGYVRLSGEVADQGILDALSSAFPHAEIAHAFASTEAGFAFDVRDGQAGFPARLIDENAGKADLRVVDGSLRIRSTRTASRYLGPYPPLRDSEGFVDTADMLDRRGDRYFFIGRREGIINVGGQKVHPEEVEAVIARHPAIRMVRVRGRPNAITGAIVVADIVLDSAKATSPEAATAEIMDSCRKTLPSYKVPVALYQVAGIELGGSGKLERVRR